MDSTQQMLRKIINHQSVMKSELLGEIKKLDKKIDGVDEKLDKVENNLTERIDKIGLQVASLEHDTSTIEDFNKLVKRVDRLEKYQNFATA